MTGSGFYGVSVEERIRFAVDRLQLLSVLLSNSGSNDDRIELEEREYISLAAALEEVGAVIAPIEHAPFAVASWTPAEQGGAREP